MNKQNDLAVFVYGTLMPGERSWAEHCEGRVVEMKRARVRGRLYDLKAAGYPAMAMEEGNSKFKIEDSKMMSEAGDGWVKGWWLRLKDEAALRGLDAWEGYEEGRLYSENEYERVRVECWGEEKKDFTTELAENRSGESLGEAWVYVMGVEKIAALEGVEVPGGEWRGRGEC
jgi:gamma-glutamylcyclotransferase (GGCT)/AIG2-like uncharacterized protein YtfP